VVAPSSRGWSGFTLTENRNRSSVFAFVGFSDGKPDSTFPENALADDQQPAAGTGNGVCLIGSSAGRVGPGERLGCVGGTNGRATRQNG
jgi:hypothetical protein